MAKLHTGIMGPFSGKIGPIIGSSWKNINYIKAAPSTPKTKKTKSPSQLAQQEKFRFLNAWLVPFHPYVTVGFFNQSQKMTEINTAFQLNYRQALVGDYPVYSMDYPKVRLSRGKLTGLLNPKLLRRANGSVRLTWDSEDPRGHYNDQVMLVLYCPANRLADGFVGLATRADGEVVFPVNPKMNGHALEAYLSVVSMNRKRASDSEYLGRLAPL